MNDEDIIRVSTCVARKMASRARVGLTLDDLVNEAAIAVMNCPPGVSEAYHRKAARSAIAYAMRMAIREEHRTKRAQQEFEAPDCTPETTDSWDALLSLISQRVMSISGRRIINLVVIAGYSLSDVATIEGRSYKEIWGQWDKSLRPVIESAILEVS